MSAHTPRTAVPNFPDVWPPRTRLLAVLWARRPIDKRAWPRPGRGARAWARKRDILETSTTKGIVGDGQVSFSIIPAGTSMGLPASSRDRTTSRRRARGLAQQDSRFWSCQHSRPPLSPNGPHWPPTTDHTTSLIVDEERGKGETQPASSSMHGCKDPIRGKDEKAQSRRRRGHLQTPPCPPTIPLKSSLCSPTWGRHNTIDNSPFHPTTAHDYHPRSKLYGRMDGSV